MTQSGKKVGVIDTSWEPLELSGALSAKIELVRLGADPRLVSRGLFAALRGAAAITHRLSFDKM